MTTIYTDQHKFFKYDEDSGDPYSSDHFRMYEFKIRMCTRSRSHDWTDCPFAHPGEKARRRDPRRYHYSSTVCADFRRGSCNMGDNCEFSHGVFESWLHPARYRTEVCKDGKNCNRKICFFAHIPRQLRNIINHCCNCLMSSPTSTLMGICNFSVSHPFDGVSKMSHFIEHVVGNGEDDSEMRDLVDMGILDCPDLGWVDDLLE
ncbi:zinc finger CCCH domain-containing protein 2-like [Impatiens glandulifera]|uniref:zinc finger CCCH domain-containing protein 2-like n=1 Tax=Impatiens glandulifera TaxID=253017 RepID=UPI001FB08CB0|nr:zinc finger CCCH domain-containing protein 2-like [Impatiens glandulifera]